MAVMMWGGLLAWARPHWKLLLALLRLGGLVTLVGGVLVVAYLLDWLPLARQFITYDVRGEYPEPDGENGLVVDVVGHYERSRSVTCERGFIRREILSSVQPARLAVALPGSETRFPSGVRRISPEDPIAARHGAAAVSMGAGRLCGPLDAPGRAQRLLGQSHHQRGAGARAGALP